MTRRGILSGTFSFYDPFGFASLVIFPGKKIFQLACHLELEWDAVLPDYLRKRWVLWLNDIKSLSQYSVPRCCVPFNNVKDIQLRMYCDGSEAGYGTVANLRVISEMNEPCVSLLLAKSRLTPLGKTSEYYPTY